MLLLKDIIWNFHYMPLALVPLFALRGKIESLKTYLFPSEGKNRESGAIEELSRQNALLNHLLSIISHDVRAPLDSLKGILPLLLNRKLKPDELQDVIMNMDHQVEQLAHFLENVLRWAKNNVEEIKPRFKQITLRRPVEEVVELYQLQAKRKEVYIYTNIPSTLTVFADEEMIRVVLRNLIANAIKFCNRDDSVYVRATELRGLVTVSVQDTGSGIGKETIPHLFTLSHVSTSGTKNEIGTGLGLTLCKEFVERMGGKITVESEEGRGSCFEFSIHSPTSPSIEFQRFIETQDRGKARQ